ncbi:FAM50A-like protein [Melia azedarach]|uniref:FAM50A-like protein n=1 Tax=Melia azedarach TaxID=155640 RepID=A0ACC1Z1G5_MELAZ|nr:FAM50A-like protein [Melia azedarach]
MKKSSFLNHSITPQVDPQLNGKPITPQVAPQLNGNLSNCIARVHCKRDWKKDARRVCMSKGPEDTKNGSVRPILPSTTESQTLLSSENKAEAQAPAGMESHPSLSLVNGETNKTKLGRRDWKAEARNKKS